jgi:hypothetical protein
VGEIQRPAFGPTSRRPPGRWHITAWQDKALTGVGPPLPLCGVTFGHWRRLLRAYLSEIDSPYRLRAAATTFWSIVNSACCWYEDRMYTDKVAQAKIEPPVIILGHWRTGTTHLHNLLCLDDRFAYPNTYQVLYPNTFLSTEALCSRLLGFFLPPTRPMDRVQVSFRAPNEDEYALCSMTLHSPYVGFVFPRHQATYDSLLTFRGVAEDIIAQWKAALTFFVKKLTWKYGRPLILKSPPNTCRIRLLLDLFPDARFVHIHRNPFNVFGSTCHWLWTTAPWYNLQRPRFDGLEKRVLRTYREMYEVFFRERSLIPAGHYHEIGFEDLEAKPVAQMRRLYESLGLPDFGHVEPALRRYLQSLGDYKKNALPKVSPALREEVAGEWRRCFEEWGYPM